MNEKFGSVYSLDSWLEIIGGFELFWLKIYHKIMGNMIEIKKNDLEQKNMFSNHIKWHSLNQSFTLLNSECLYLNYEFIVWMTKTVQIQRDFLSRI